MMENYYKMKVGLRYWLIGQKFYKAVEAMNFAESHHNGKRKDNSPEFSHQVSQAHLARTLVHHLRYKEEIFIVIFLHDICEDKDVSFEEMEHMFGPIVARALKLITKVYRGVKTPNDVYYPRMTECEITSFCKCVDRIHNLTSMLGGFTPQKRVSYVQETIEYTIPMLKSAKRKFPDQEAAYENLKFIINSQIQLYNALDKDHK